MKFPNFTFEGGRKQTTKNFSYYYKLFKFGISSKNPTVGEFLFSVALKRIHLCGFRQRANINLL